MISPIAPAASIGATRTLGRGPRGLHHAWPTFRRLHARFDAHAGAGRIDYRPAHAVWRLDPDAPAGGWVLRATRGERAPEPVTVTARAVLVATGAHDRQLPFPGWTLPGVVAVGGAQALLKATCSRPGAGSWSPARVRSCCRSPTGCCAPAPRWRRSSRPPRPPAISVPRGRPPGAPCPASCARVPAMRRPSPATACPCGEVTPSPRRSAPTMCVKCRCARSAPGGRRGRTAGGASPATRSPSATASWPGVGGADLALAEGALAADAIAASLGRAGALADHERERLRRRRASLRAFAALLATAHPVRDGFRGWLRADTPVCRCEEVTLGELQAAVALGARDARAAKLLDLLVGADDVLLELMLAGAKGWIAGYPNALPVTCFELYEACRAQDLERALPLHRLLHPLLRWDSKAEFVQAIKLSMDMAGRHGGPCRPPRPPLPAEQEAAVRAATDDALAGWEGIVP